MSPKRYRGVVAAAFMRCMAEEQGRLLAVAAQREAGAERMRAELEQSVMTAAARDRVERSIAECLDVARATRAEAELMERAALRGNVSRRRPAPPPPAERVPTVEDVVHTLRYAAEGELAETPAFREAIDLLSRTAPAPPPAADQARAEHLLRSLAWPAGDRAARADAALDCLARLP